MLLFIFVIGRGKYFRNPTVLVLLTTETNKAVVNTSLTMQTTNNLTFISISSWIALIYYFLIKKTVIVGINWINHRSLLPLFFSLHAMKPVDSSCGKKIQPQLWVTQHTPARWATDSASPVQPRRCRTPTTLPRPWSAFLCLTLNYLEEGKDVLRGGKPFA